VELAKWEDRGYHALRQASEKAQRQLHRMQRAADAVLLQAAAAPLAAAAKAMGFADLADPEAVLLESSEGAKTGGKGVRKRRREAAARAELDSGAQVRAPVSSSVCSRF
jgi:midasin